jgi:anaerobic selenocysteine-containing dehydrogenase
MSDRTQMDRRGFLKGSAWLVAAAGLAVAAPASAQQEQKAPEEKKPESKDQAKTEEPSAKKPLVDKNGREYRVCDMCGGNMYLTEKTWTCEQCGFSYEV